MKLILSKIFTPAIVCDKNGRFLRGNVSPEALPCLERSVGAVNLLAKDSQDAYFSLVGGEGRSENGQPYLLCKRGSCHVYILFNGSDVFSDVASEETVWLFINGDIPDYITPDLFKAAIKLCEGSKAITAKELAKAASALSETAMQSTASLRFADDSPYSYELEEALSSLKKSAELLARERGCNLRCSVQSQAAFDASSIISEIHDFHKTAPLFMSILSAFCDISENGIINVGFKISDDNLNVLMTTECKRLSSKTENAPARIVLRSLSEIEDMVRDELPDECQFGWVVQRQRRMERERFCADAELALPLRQCVETGIRNRNKIESFLCDFDLVNTLTCFYGAFKCKSHGKIHGFCAGCKSTAAKFTLQSHGNHNFDVK